jgi:Fe/S biogenesis protein NfuA
MTRMLNFTERAREIVKAYLDQSSGELEALRIAAHSGSPVAPRFELTLVSLSEKEAEEREMEGPGFPVLVRSSEVERLTGADVDFVERVNESGFEVRLAREGSAGPGDNPPEAPAGPIAERVRAVLDGQVNPAIAAHGGMIDLVDVQESEVFVRMSGGCQGCALSRMTLRQGVEKMLRQAIPELTAVHDVTDHASGENPFFQH